MPGDTCPIIRLKLFARRQHPIDESGGKAGVGGGVQNGINFGVAEFLHHRRHVAKRLFHGPSLNRRLLCRQIDPPDGPFPFPDGDWVIGRPPFSKEQEIALFEQLAVDWLVVKNAGGDASATKLEAARALQIPVAMIARPPQPDAPKVETVEEALAWVDGLV